MVIPFLAMRHRRPLAGAAFALAAALCAQSAQALATKYDNAADYAAALAAAGLAGSAYRFTGGPSGQFDPGSFTVGPATFAGQNGDNGASFLVRDAYGLAGGFYSHRISEGVLLGVEQRNLVQVEFDSPVRAFAFGSSVSNDGGSPGTAGWPTSGTTPLRLAISSGDLLDFTTPASDGNLPSGSAPIGFGGLVSDTPFASVLVSVTQAQNFQITDFNVAAVPEPATPLLMLAGLAAVGAAVRQVRRRRH